MRTPLRLCVVLALCLSAAFVRADVKLPNVFGSHMVLQRDKALPIWGTAAPGETVTVAIDGTGAAPVQADAKGAWKVVLPAMPADGKPHRLTVQGNNKIELDDILLGEVWIGSGQSNMEMGMTMCRASAQQIPQDKINVGERLALWALAKTYAKSGVVYSGPLYSGMTVDGDKVRLALAHAEGLKSRDGKPLAEFQVAGADGKFVPAEATIDGQTVVVRAAGVTAPAQVRFGWSKTANPNLVNAAGLPASPFQTKDWQGGMGE